MCERCDVPATGDEAIFQARRRLRAMDRPRPVIETVYLPGDEVTARLSLAFRRDSQLTALERRASHMGADCARRRYFYPKGLTKWPCSYEEPCCYCRAVNDEPWWTTE